MSAPADEPDLTIEIDELGDIHVGSKAVLRRLAAAAGRWRLAPSLRELLVWERCADEPAADEQPAVLMAGVIDAPGSLANILNFTHFSSLDCTLTVHSGMTRKALWFKRGQLLAATSNLPEDRLGALMVRWGLITEEHLVAAIREITPHRRLGTVLVASGLVTSHDLYEAVRQQAEEIFHSVLLFRRGTFVMSRLGDTAAIPARLHLDTQGLLLEGLRRIDELGYFRDKIPSLDVVLVRREPPQATPPEGAAAAVYARVDATRSLRDIARLTRLGEFAATKAAFELVQTGFVEVRQPSELRRHKPVPVGALPDDAAAAIVAAYNGAFARLYGTMSAKGKAASLRQGVSTFLSGSARFGGLFDGVELADDGTLPTERLLGGIAALDDAARLEQLQRGLNELLFFVLFIAGDSIERREEEELHARVAVALERLPRARVSEPPDSQ